MPLARALSVGLLKAIGSIKLEAMPFLPAAIAWSNAVTIWDTLEVAEPVHSVGHPVLGRGEEAVGGDVVDESELVRRVFCEQWVGLVVERLSRRATLGQHIHHSAEQRNRCRHHASVAQEATP